jgi:glutamate dehydrogenase
MEIGRPYNIFEMAQKQFDRTADLLGLDKPTRAFLRIPVREYQFSLPIFLDNGETQILRAFTVQFNDARGPTKGGVRFHPSETVDTIRALGMWMTWKCAVMNLPLGGSSSGVACDPHGLSPMEMERICRAFVRRIAHFSGPDWDILGPDMMTGHSTCYGCWMNMKPSTAGRAPALLPANQSAMPVQKGAKRLAAMAP